MEQASKGHELAFYDSINFDQINVTEWFNCNMTRTRRRQKQHMHTWHNEHPTFCQYTRDEHNKPV